MKFSLVGSFNLAHGYLGAAKALRKLGHEVDFVPAALYFHESETVSIAATKIEKDLLKQKPDIILWWRAEHLSAENLAKFKNKIEGKHILYSWDDPFQWEVHREMPAKCQSLDVAFSCCESSLQNYKNNGCDAYYCPPGFDPEVHYPEEDEEYKCDISIVCTNLYSGNALTKYKHVDRGNLLDSILNFFPDIDLRIYGSEQLGERFPEGYKGWVDFDESRKVFYNSKCSISTHIRPDGHKYINERVCQITGSKGLLLVDPVNGLEHNLVNGQDCIVMDLENRENFKNQIKDIIENPDNYNRIRENGYNVAMERFTWDSWAKIILNGIK
jgi:spore maturation protein CgeB